MKKSTLLAGVGLAALIWVLSSNGGSDAVFTFKDNPEATSTIYFVYSPTCPHCHELANYLQTLNLTVNIEAVSDGRFLQSVFSNNGINWKYGVPVMVGITEGQVVALEGYPDATQLNDGYFVSKSYEEGICNSQGGIPNDVSYKFCIQPDGFLLGNKYSVDYLLDFCTQNKCETL